MAERGRASVSSLSVVHAAVQRPEPPAHLTEVERQVWILTVEGLPAEWFRPETLPLLEQYCCHASRARDLAEKIRHGRLKAMKLKDAMKLELEQTRTMAHLATKMRLTQQSTFDRKKAKGTKSAPFKPWGDDGEE